MKDAGSALMGIGFATRREPCARGGGARARSPLIDAEITGARGILLSIAGGDDLSLFEVNEAAEVIRAAATDDTNIIFGATIDDRLTGQIWITVVATGLGGTRAPPLARDPPARADGRSRSTTPSFLRDQVDGRAGAPARLSAMRGAVAGGHPLTAQAGARALAEGGNAVDACVAAAFASAVTESP